MKAIRTPMISGTICLDLKERQPTDRLSVKRNTTVPATSAESTFGSGAVMCATVDAPLTRFAKPEARSIQRAGEVRRCATMATEGSVVSGLLETRIASHAAIGIAITTTAIAN